MVCVLSLLYIFILAGHYNSHSEEVGSAPPGFGQVSLVSASNRSRTFVSPTASGSCPNIGATSLSRSALCQPGDDIYGEDRPVEVSEVQIVAQSCINSLSKHVGIATMLQKSGITKASMDGMSPSSNGRPHHAHPELLETSRLQEPNPSQRKSANPRNQRMLPNSRSRLSTPHGSL